MLPGTLTKQEEYKLYLYIYRSLSDDEGGYLSLETLGKSLRSISKKRGEYVTNILCLYFYNYNVMMFYTYIHLKYLVTYTQGNLRVIVANYC